MQIATEKINIGHQRRGKKRSTGTSILKWAFIVLNGPGSLISILTMALLLRWALISTSKDMLGSFIYSWVCFSIFIEWLSIVAIVAAYGENAGWLKSIALFVSSIIAIVALNTTIAYISLVRDSIKEACLKACPVEECNFKMSSLDSTATNIVLSLLLVSLIYSWMAWTLATNLLAEKSIISQQA